MARPGGRTQHRVRVPGTSFVLLATVTHAPSLRSEALREGKRRRRRLQNSGPDDDLSETVAKAYPMTDLIEAKDAGHELWEGMRRMIACEFPEFSASQVSLLNLVYWHRQALITLIRLTQRVQNAPAASRAQVERTTQRAEAAYVVLREVVRRMILSGDLHPSKRAALTRQFLEIPLDELAIDGEPAPSENGQRSGS